MAGRVPVLVVGGGSVGLFAALLLHRHGVPTVLVERRDGPSIHPRATGIGSRTVEILRELGLAAAVDARSVDMTVGGLGKVIAPTLAEADFTGPAATPRPSSGGPAAAPFHLRGICAQDRLDAVLADAAAARGVDLRWSTRLVGLHQDADGVTVELDGPDGRSELRCDHVVAADGARSPVRDRLGIGTSGPGDLGTSKIGILFRAPLQPYLRGASFATCTITTPDAPGLLVMVDGDQDWVFHVEGTDAADFPPERCVALVRAAVGAPDLPVEVRSVLGWQPRALLADRFADGRVFLAGDAAHAMAAMGGFGLNTGVADAHNLAWKLAAVHRGEAGPGLLDTYEAERRPVAAATIDQALRRAADVRLHWGVGPEADAMRVAAGVWAGPIVHLGQRYASAAIVDGDPALPSTTDLAAVLDGSPGSRVPHVWCDPDGSVSTLDLVGPGWALLTGPGATGWPATSADLAVHRVTAPGWAEAAGITTGGALLVRPDGIVAWRSVDAPSDSSEPNRVLAGLLHRATAQR